MKYFNLTTIGLVCLVLLVQCSRFKVQGIHSVSDGLSNGACPVKYTSVFHGTRVVRKGIIDREKIETEKSNLQLAVGNLLAYPSELASILLPILNNVARIQGEQEFKIAPAISEKISKSLRHWIQHRNPKLFYGEMLREYREMKGYTVKALANQAGLSPTLIGENEVGKSLTNTISLLRIINVLELNERKSSELLDIFWAAKLRELSNPQIIKPNMKEPKEPEYLRPLEIIDGLEGALENPDAVIDFCDYVKQLIEERGMNKREVAKKIGVEEWVMSRILNGKSPPFRREKYYALIKALELSLEEKGDIYPKWIDAVVRYIAFDKPIKKLKQAADFLMHYAPEEIDKILLDDELLGDYIRGLFVIDN